MQSCLQREEIAQGIHFSHVTDEKFYSNRLSVHFITRLNPETVTDNAIVPFILRLGCRSCPDFTALNRRLGLLYGAQLGADVSRYGDRQILSVSVKGLDRRVALKNEDMVGALSELLCDIVLDPLVEGDGFLARNTELERQNLIDTIESEINDKRVYAQAQCLSLLYGENPRAIRPYGTVEKARKITPQSAYQAYRKLLQEARIEILFAGSGDPASAANALRARFGAVLRQAAPQQEAAPLLTKGELRERVETMPVAQSKLSMGFCCDTKGSDSFALRMFGAMYGGTPFSKLFLNVREKMSLCYYCSARYDRSNGILLVNSGVEKEKKEGALGEIRRQLEAMQKGDFTDEELHNTLLAMNTGFDATVDSLYAIESWYLTRILGGEVLTPAQEKERMAAVTREDVIRAAQGCTLEAVYFLTAPDGVQGGQE